MILVHSNANQVIFRAAATLQKRGMTERREIRRAKVLTAIRTSGNDLWALQEPAFAFCSDAEKFAVPVTLVE